MFIFTHILYFVAFAVTCFIIPCSTFTCIHDKVNPREAPSVYPRSVKKYHEIVEEREKDPAKFEPLELFFYFENVERTVATSSFYNIKLALDKINEYIAKTFQVRKRGRPYLLERIACDQQWQYGINRGKCSKYSGAAELCSVKSTKVSIPDKFLDKLEVYDADSPKPKYVAPSGAGLHKSNFIIFIIAHPEDVCDETDAFAFGTQCRIHKMTNEPLAGLLNLCPDYFANKIYDTKHYYNILLHEIFHILGFSINLFEKFLPCQRGIYCNVPKSAIQEDSNGTIRMMFPHVITSMQNHFKCSKPDFGAPMETTPHDGGSSYTSHWHPVMMYSSIMTPQFAENDYIYVDNITLAAFASTGWYRIKFDAKPDFLFGKDQGCDFGLDKSCKGKYFCDPSENKTSCDILQETIGKCTEIVPSYPCGIYKPFSVHSCKTEKTSELGLSSYALGQVRKCLLSGKIGGKDNETNIPVCVPVVCETNKKYNVLINMTWIACEDDQKKTVKDYTIICAPGDLFCSAVEKFPTKYQCPKNQIFIIAVRIYFRKPDLKDLLDYNSFKNFKVSTLRAIAEQMSIPVNYIVNSSINVFKKIYLDFSICPPTDIGFSRLNKMLSKIQEFMDGGNFMDILKGPEDVVISSNSIIMDPTESISFSDHEGFHALLVFPVVVAIFLLVTLGASLVRLIIIHKGRPRRIVEDLIPLDIDKGFRQVDRGIRHVGHAIGFGK